MKRLTEERVLPADPWHHRAQLGKDKRAGQRDHPSRHPNRKNQERRLDRLRDDIRVNENARADDAADDDHRRVEEVKFVGEFHSFLKGRANWQFAWSSRKTASKESRQTLWERRPSLPAGGPAMAD